MLKSMRTTQIGESDLPESFSMDKLKTKRVISLALLMALAMTSVFASSGNDFGFNAYMTSIKTWMTAIAGGLLVLSLIIWGVKAAITRNIQPNDWKALAVIIVGGVVIILAAQIIGGIFGDLNSAI